MPAAVFFRDSTALSVLEVTILIFHRLRDHSIPHRPTFPVCFFGQFFWKDAPFSHNTYVTDDRHARHRMAPPYLNQLVPVSNLPGRRRLRSSFTLQLHAPQYPLSLIPCRSFHFLEHSARRRAVCAPFVSSFRRQLKTFLLVISRHLHFRTYYALVDFATV